jgi:predicted cupin superfamily sugar epimerase
MDFSTPRGTAPKIIAALSLIPLPREGGFFRQTWRSQSSSAILFLLTPRDFSALHQLDREEVWHFHGGEPVEHVQLDPQSGEVRISRLGADILAGDTPQTIVRAGIWQGARLIQRTRHATADYSLLGCTVSPPWDERGFALGERETLTQAFPAAAELIRALTR